MKYTFWDQAFLERALLDTIDNIRSEKITEKEIEIVKKYILHKKNKAMRRIQENLIYVFLTYKSNHFRFARES